MNLLFDILDKDLALKLVYVFYMTGNKKFQRKLIKNVVTKGYTQLLTELLTENEFNIFELVFTQDIQEVIWFIITSSINKK